MTEKIIHEGRNVKRIREMMGIKQDALAFDLGLSQQAISSIEQKEALDKDMLEKIAAILKVPVEAIKNFSEDVAINIISSTLHDNAGSIFNNPTFNPLDKVVELYERMLKDKEDMIEELKKLINK
ncbi:MAG: helix-turn-helix transcriptional regulator [Ferruginibacter sp.]